MEPSATTRSSRSATAAEPAARSWRGPLRILVDATVASLVWVGAEAILVGLANRAQFADTGELHFALRRLPLVAWPLAAPGAWLGAAALVLVQRAEGSRRARGLLAGLLGVAGALEAHGVSTGRHLAALPLRASFVAALALLAGGLGWALAPGLARLVRRAPTAAGLGALLLAVLTALANAHVLPRLYPAFHLGLALLTLALVAWTPLLWHVDEQTVPLRRRPLLTSYAALVALLLGTVALTAPVLRQPLRRADNLRFVMAERAPTLGLLMRWLLPAEDDPGAALAAAPTPESEAPSIDWRGRDVLLITVDALRADHLGAYGYRRPISPAIDALAAAGTRFQYAYTATPHTSYAVSSLMTGKYMRPLLLQGAGNDPDTLARLLRGYGYRTAGFYPPAVFFIDPERFVALRDRGLDFEYRKVEPADAPLRISQVDAYLSRLRPERRALLWVHLFEPHEPYQRHPGIDLGDRDLDRYDGEIAAVDRGVQQLVDKVRARRPGTVVIFSSDHGEEFGEHGGRYHGTTVYEEQVRVPLIVNAPGLVPQRVVEAPVQTVDLVPTLLGALRIPRPARVRGRDLGPWLGPTPPPSAAGFAFAETDEATMLAEGALRLVCARRVGACQLFDLAADPLETRDASARHFERFQAMKARLREVEAAHGRYEIAGLRAEGRAWPEAIRRSLAGDGDAAIEVAGLLEDADLSYRRKAAEVLFELARPETAAALRLSLTRDEDDVVRRWAALALTRLGEGAGRTLELVEDRDVSWRRLAALALAEHGDGRGEDTLVAWWQSEKLDFQRARQLVAAFGKIRAKRAVVPLLRALDDVRLRPDIARALADIGESAARPGLLEAFTSEPYVPARLALGESLIRLGAGAEMGPALARFLGTPDPLPEGLVLAERGGFLASVGGPDKKDLGRLRDGRGKTRRLQVFVPRGGNGKGVRLLLLGRSSGSGPATLRLGPEVIRGDRDDLLPVEIDPRRAFEVLLEPSAAPRQQVFELPESLGVKAGAPALLALWQSEQADVSALALVPLADELPPPPPKPWIPSASDSTDETVDDGT